MGGSPSKEIKSSQGSFRNSSPNEFHPYQVSSRRPSSQESTILFLGESGVGKSTLISGLGNYLSWPTFEEAKKNKMDIRIPLEFKIQRKNPGGQIEERVVKVGHPEENENFNEFGESATQKPKVHQFNFQGKNIRIIDTPGLSDSRGADEDKEHLEFIRKYIYEEREIHAICIFLKSNDSKFRNEFEVVIRDFLSLFPKSALKNVFFFFTYSSGASFGIGDVLFPLTELRQKFKNSHGVSFELQKKNMYTMDSESFRYLVLKEKNMVYDNRPEKEYEFSWNETAKQIKDFFSFIKTICPVDVRKIKAADELVKISLELEKFIKTDEKLVKGLSQEARELLKIKSEPIFYATRSLTMATEHYRLKTNLSKSDPEEVRKSVDELLPIVRYSDIYNRLLRFMDHLSVFQQD